MTEDETLRWLQDEYDAISAKEFWARYWQPLAPISHLQGETQRPQDDPAFQDAVIRAFAFFESLADLVARLSGDLTSPDDARAHAALHAREVASREP